MVLDLGGQWSGANGLGGQSSIYRREGGGGFQRKCQSSDPRSSYFVDTVFVSVYPITETNTTVAKVGT